MIPDFTNMQLGISIGTLFVIGSGFFKIIWGLRGYKDDISSLQKELQTHIKESDEVRETIINLVNRMGTAEIESAKIETDLSWIKAKLLEISGKL